MQYLHSHFSSMNCREQPPHSPQHARPPAMIGSQRTGAQQQQQVPAGHMAAQQQAQHAQQAQQQHQAPATAPKVLSGAYRPSPLSRSVSLATPTKTPTKSSTLPAAQQQQPPMTAAAQQQQVTRQATRQASLQQQFAQQQLQHAPSPPGADDAVVALQRKLVALTQGAQRSEGMAQTDVVAMMAGAASAAGAHGAVHIVRTSNVAQQQQVHAATAIKQQAPQPPHAAYSLTATPPATPAKAPGERVTPLVKRLYIPGSPNGSPNGEDGVPQMATPGPEGPGIKARLKWHLARQGAGAM
jgi:hypothetical protein